MEWENNDNGRQRWCVRLFQGGGFAGPLFDGFDNVYVGQPGAFLSFPPTQWTRWRQPVIGMPTDPADSRTTDNCWWSRIWVRFWFSTPTAARWSAARWTWSTASTPPIRRRGLTDCVPARAGLPDRGGPAFSTASKMVVHGVWQPGAQPRCWWR